MVIHFKPVNYIAPSPHVFLANAWNKQHGLPSEATRVCYDSDRNVLIWMVGDEQFEVHTLTPPPWMGKDVA